MSGPEITCYIRSPSTKHTHTAILLHDEFSACESFGLNILSSETSDGQKLYQKFPGWRWVFPTVHLLPYIPNTAYPGPRSWFRVDPLQNVNEEQEVQVPGLSKSVKLILDLIRDEIDFLGGKTNHTYFGGVGEGMAVALWTLLCSPARLGGQRLGGCVGFSGYLPFASDLNAALLGLYGTTRKFDDPRAKAEVVSRWLLEKTGYVGLKDEKLEVKGLLATPVILGHHLKNEIIDVADGRHAYRILEQLEMRVEWLEYDEYDPGYCWIKTPEGFDDIVGFFEKRVKEVKEICH